MASIGVAKLSVILPESVSLKLRSVRSSAPGAKLPVQVQVAVGHCSKVAPVPPVPKVTVVKMPVSVETVLPLATKKLLTPSRPQCRASLLVNVDALRVPVTTSADATEAPATLRAAATKRTPSILRIFPSLTYDLFAFAVPLMNETPTPSRKPRIRPNSFISARFRCQEFFEDSQKLTLS